MSKASLNELAIKLGYRLERSKEFQNRKAVYKNNKFIGNFTAYNFAHYLKERGEI